MKSLKSKSQKISEAFKKRPRKKQKIFCKKCSNFYLEKSVLLSASDVSTEGFCSDNCKQNAKNESNQKRSKTFKEKKKIYPKCECGKTKKNKRDRTCGNSECIKKPIKKRIIKCSICRTEYDSEKVSFRSKNEIFRGKCNFCKKQKKNILHKKSLNERKSISERMKIKNPMFDEKIKEKAHNALRKNIKNGKTIYKKGKNHHLFTGKRHLSKALRDVLYHRWTIRVLERDEFKCRKCQSKKGLHVHHRFPLRYIVDFLRRKYKLSKNDLDKIKLNPIFNLILEDGIAIHSLRNGITLCGQCHCDIDPRFRGIKK